MPTTLGAAYRDLRDAFRAAGFASPEIDARMLVAAVAGIEPARVMVEEDRPLDSDQLAQIARMRAARLGRTPVGRILGRRAFWGMEFVLSPQTLEPRPDTESLVEAVLADVDARSRRTDSLRFADLGTGSGAILTALLSELPNASGIGTDISAEALATARRNAQANGVGDRAAFQRSSFGEALEGQGGFDFIVSNPPYITDAALARLDPEVRLHDPERALAGGPDGLDAYRAIVVWAASHLHSPAASLYLEIGYDQAASVSGLCRAAGFSNITLRQDLSGLDRVVIATM
ncbi:peptide chain release factor N(5)-glutamine methyltransferase [Breoghania sp. L-A4]|nr:peptide chain release factor N(5)-glutamine methyltransferase [Breoghania sp. L-A4]